MPSYVVNGVTKGIGFEFLRQLSADPANIVIGLARDHKTVGEKAQAEIGRENVHVINGDLDNPESLKKAAEETAKITGGSLDYLIANGARMSQEKSFDSFGDLYKDPAGLEEEMMAITKTNIMGTIHLFSLFMPLILKGQQKKMIFISSGHGDLDFINQSGIDVAAPYAVGKMACVIVVAKYGAEYARQGVLCMSISPGVVQTGNYDNLTTHQQQSVGNTMVAFKKYAPHFTGMMTPEESVKQVTSVFEKASLANGDGGSFVSHFGTKQWI